MFFSVLPLGKRTPGVTNQAILGKDYWDDWFTFETLYSLSIYDEHGEFQAIGPVKIGQFGMAEAQRSPDLPDAFDALDERFFSLGQDDSYYEALAKLSDALRTRVLVGLRDMAADLDLFERALGERVTKISLLRSVSALTVRGQFGRLLAGNARLTPYHFSYRLPRAKGLRHRLCLSFDVQPESQPPTNIHVLIGRNGVGKTRLLRLMSRALLLPDSARTSGSFQSSDTDNVTELFANVVSVTFSAFDPFDPLPEKKDATAGLRYSYIGLHRPSKKNAKVSPPKSTQKLRAEFVASVRACGLGQELSRWRRALETLETDPLFRDAAVTTLADGERGEDWERSAKKLFDRLSSGHKVVLLTVTRLVETVDERTLVLIDEPEAHLHPPLLSAFVRALSDLLIQRNGVAIIATHSPVVLQEVPRLCVWKLRRSGLEARAERPEIETFGENVGVLTREAFGFEVTDSGFHKLLQNAVGQDAEYETILDVFDQQLGAEARGIIRGLIATRDME